MCQLEWATGYPGMILGVSRWHYSWISRVKQIALPNVVGLILSNEDLVEQKDWVREFLLTALELGHQFFPCLHIELKHGLFLGLEPSGYQAKTNTTWIQPFLNSSLGHILNELTISILHRSAHKIKEFQIHPLLLYWSLYSAPHKHLELRLVWHSFSDPASTWRPSPSLH